ncbi:MAG: iron chelate uptake ABC transporter family permease subunit [Lachnospiraceae bacterium]
MNSSRLPLENNGRSGEYHKNKVKSIWILILLGVILAAAVLLSLWAGSYDTPVTELLRGIANKANDPKINVVVRNVRLPRICTAVIAGAGLGVVGCILQAILDNPLASASTLGVSQGASFGAAFAIIGLNAGAQNGGSLWISLAAFAGSMGVANCHTGIVQVQPDYTGIHRSCRGGHQFHVYGSDHTSAVFRG